MTRGKQTCKILKDIRRQIAEANDIELITSECNYKGDCLGSCPTCEAELRHLELQLRKRQLAGKVINLAGISACAISMIAPITLQAQVPPLKVDQETTYPDTKSIIKGHVVYNDTMPDGTIIKERCPNAKVTNMRTRMSAITDIDGNFQISAHKGDALRISSHGFINDTTVVSNRHPIEITLQSDPDALTDDILLLGYSPNLPAADIKIVDEDNSSTPATSGDRDSCSTTPVEFKNKK